MSAALRLVPALCALACCACAAAPPAKEPQPSLYEDATERAGLEFTHRMGPRLTYFMPEIMGAGGALLDYDGDGDLDLYLVDGAASPGVEPFADAPRNRLLRNDPGPTFRDVTAGSGVDDPGFGMGAAAGDFDNDGRIDLYVTNYGENELYRNLGDGTFARVTERAGVGDPGWSASATFLDYDADGWLDLFVTNYVALDPEVVCGKDTGRPDYCDVGHFSGTSDRLYRNLGDGRFADVSAASGIGAEALKGLGVVAADLTGDGRIDVYVANDMQRNQLWVNRGDGTFEEQALRRGVAYDDAGAAQAGMGLVLADLDGDARADLFVTHLGGQSHTLYRRGAADGFSDATAASALFEPTQRYTGFGTAAIDVEHDGDLDLVIANGHVFRAEPEPGAALGAFWNEYAQPGSLLLNAGGRFVDASARAGSFGSEPAVGRGLAVGDIDDDGDLDFVATSCGGGARLYLNRAPKAGHWLTVEPWDDALRRDVTGSEITLVAAGRRRVGFALRGYGYLTSNDPRAHFGLGPVAHVDAIEVRWPDGTRETFDGVEADRHVRLVRGTGRAG